MTKEEAKELLPILQAFTEGKEIEVREKYGNEVSNWVGIGNSHEFSAVWFNYRVKPESKYHPFKSSDEAFEEMKKHEPFGWIKEKNSNFKMCVLSLDNDGVLVGDYEDDKVFLSYETIFKHHAFADGSPIGIKEV